MCGTTAEYKQVSPEIHFTPWKCITYARGTAWVGDRHGEHFAAVQFPLYFEIF
jgi:hypothetical protein